jgi:hypothetical protein
MMKLVYPPFWTKNWPSRVTKIFLLKKTCFCRGGLADFPPEKKPVFSQGGWPIAPSKKTMFLGAG